MKVIILPIIVDSAYLPTTASESRNDPTKFNVQSVDLTKFEPVNISHVKSYGIYCWEATANRQLFSLKTREKAEILCQN